MSFHELRKNQLLCYGSDNLTSPHGFTTRLGGVSTGYLRSMNLGVRRGDTLENVQKNYEILGDALGFDPKKIVCAVQVHKDDIRTATQADWGKGLYSRTDYEADGLITNVPGTVLQVYSADCGTLLYEDRRTGAVGACHAGWRGTALGIAEKTARAMMDRFGSRPEDLYVALGPCIGRCCFETDRDVPEAMRAALGPEAEAAIDQAGEKFHVDLKAINTIFLQKAGIPLDHIDVSPLCTACDPETFWSHRRHGDQRGSLGALIVAGERP
jgi:hypothetical protein